ncbi:MAG: hypothetical protein RBT16_08765 [Desulfococcus multivorans]|jgi:hypothetical protein|nr:hypothetical protein [Desulfococcus multivorans]
MYRETSSNGEIHISHNLSRRHRVKREERPWDQVIDIYHTAKIEMRCETVRRVQ